MTTIKPQEEIASINEPPNADQQMPRRTGLGGVSEADESAPAVEEPHNPLHPPGFKLPGSARHFPAMRPGPRRWHLPKPQPQRKGDFKPDICSLDPGVGSYAAITHSDVLAEVRRLLIFSRFYESAGFTAETKPTEQQLIAMSLSELQELYSKLNI